MMNDGSAEVFITKSDETVGHGAQWRSTSYMKQMTMIQTSGRGSIRVAVVDHGGNPSVMHDAKAMTVVGCASDLEVLEGLVQTVPVYEFLFGWFIGIANAMGCECDRRAGYLFSKSAPHSLCDQG